MDRRMNGGGKKRIIALYRFLAHDIWFLPAEKMTGARGAVLFWIRVFLISARGYSSDNLPLQAAALTFYTLLSLVPLIAMAFGIARGFSLDSLLAQEITAKFGQNSEIAGLVIDFSRRYLETTRSGLIAGVGMAVLAWTVIMTMGNIENSFNRIHRVHAPRTILRKFTDYLTMIFAGVILFSASSGLTVLGTQWFSGQSELKDIPGATLLFRVLLDILPLILMCSLFTLLYKVMPNRRIGTGAALGGGILAGIVYQSLQWLYIRFQIGVSSYGAIYGSFAALPLFIVWLRLSWSVILAGAEVARAIPVGRTCGFIPPFDRVSAPVGRLVTLRVLRSVFQEAAQGRHTVVTNEIARGLMVPVPLVEDVLERTAKAEMVLRTTGSACCDAYVPAGKPEQYRVVEVLEKLETAESGELLSAATGKDGARINSCLALLGREMRHSPANLPLVDL